MTAICINPNAKFREIYIESTVQTTKTTASGTLICHMYVLDGISLRILYDKNELFSYICPVTP